MQKAIWPADRKAFRDKYLAAIMVCSAFLISLNLHAQVDTTKRRTPINGTGFNWKNGSFDSSGRAPRDTFKLAVADSGSFAYKNGDWYLWTGYLWKLSSGSGSGGSTDTTSLSNRINTKKDKVDSVGLAGYSTNANRLKLADSLTAIFNSLFKLSTDSVRLSGYTTVANKNKLADSLTANFNALISSYKLGNDSVRLSGYTTVANKNKLADSLTANFNALLALYKLKGDSVALGGYTTVAHANKIADSLRIVFNTLLLGKVDTGSRANIYIINQGTGVQLLSAHDSFLVGKRLFDTARVSWRQRVVGTDTSVYAVFDTTGLSGGGTTFDSLTAQGGNFHTDGFNQGKYVQIKDSTSYATFKRLYKTMDSLGAIILKKGDSTQYATFGRLYKTMDSLNLVMLHKGDSAGVGYTTLARTRKVIDSLGALIAAGTSVANSTAVIGVTRIAGAASTAKRSDAADPVDTTEPNGLKKYFLPLFLGVNKLIDQHGFSVTFSGGGQFNLDSLKLTQIAAPPTLLNYVSLGNSITFGQGASIVDSCYRRRATTYYGLTNIDLSLSGSGMWKAAANFLSTVNPGALNFTTLDAGFNDIRRNGWNILTHRKIINGTISTFMNHNMASWVPGDDASVLHSSTFATGYQPSSVGGKTTGSHGLVSQTLGDTAHWAFTGTTVGIGLIGGDGTGGFYNFAAFQIYIDNALVYTGTSNQQYDGVSDGVYDNKRGPMGIYFTGLSAGSHFIKIVQNQATNYLAVDYFCTLIPPSQSVNPLMVIHATKMTTAGYATSPSSATPALTDSLNALTDSIVASFPAGYKVYVAKPELSGFNPLTDVGGDGIHPNDGGYAKIFNSMKAALLSFGIPGTDGTIYHGSDGNYYVSVLGQLKRLAYFGKDSTNNVLNQTANIQTGGFNIQSGIVNTIIAKSATLNGTAALLNLTPQNSQDGISSVGTHVTGSWLPTHITAAIDGGMLFALQNTSVAGTSAYSAISLYSGGGATSGPAYVRFGNFASGRSFSVGIDPVTSDFGIRDGYFDSANTKKYLSINRNSQRMTAGVTTQFNDTVNTPNIGRKLLDTTNYKPVVVDASGNQWKTDWAVFTGASQPFTDATAIIKNSSDPTKLFRPDASGISSGTTVVETIPNYSFTPASLGHAQTFTGVNTFTAGGLFVNSSDIELNSGSAGSLFVSPVDVSIAGAVDYSSVSFTSSFTISTSTATYSGAFITCGTLSAAGVITLPSSGAGGRTYKLINTNNTSNAWTFAGAVLKDGFGNTITSFPNGYTYEIFFNGSTWDIKSISYIGSGRTGIPAAGSYSSVGAATTTFTVTIGITEPNSTYKVNVTPTDVLGAALFYVNNKTTTTFDVVYLSGLTGTVSFDWVVTP